MSRIHLICADCGLRISSRVGIQYLLPTFCLTPLKKQGVFQRSASIRKLRVYIDEPKILERLKDDWKDWPLLFEDDHTDLYYCTVCHRMEQRHYFRIRASHGTYTSGNRCVCGGVMTRVLVQPINDSIFDEDGKFHGRKLHEGDVHLLTEKEHEPLDWVCPNCGGKHLYNDVASYTMEEDDD